jgi:D-alanyl-D-alanine carboxypeptidase (penicillin-binding protein 5/6)
LKSDQAIPIAARFALLVEAESGAVLLEKNADELMHPSSMAKLMSAEPIFKAIVEGHLDLDDTFTISENAWLLGGPPSGDSTMYAEFNSRVKVRDLLYGMIVCSGNDASIALAEGMAGSEAEFAKKLNKRARQLGLTKSYFTNATGLADDTMRVTARDLAKLTRHLIGAYPDFFGIYAAREFTWNGIRQKNRNPLLTMGIGADGMKTGFTRLGGYGLVGTALQRGVRLIVVVNGLRSADDRANEARKLLDWGRTATLKTVASPLG